MFEAGVETDDTSRDRVTGALEDMALELDPHTHGPVTAFEVAERLRAEFAFVLVDAEAGRAAALRSAAWLEEMCERLGAGAFSGRGAEALAAARRLRNLGEGEALQVSFGDDPDLLLKFTVWPGQRIVFGFRGSEDEAAQRPLIDRCARALKCEVVLV